MPAEKRIEAAAVLDYRELPTPDAEHGLHPSGTLTVRPTSDAAVSLFAGSDPGGLRCTSGVCRVLPAFEGVRLDGSFSF